MKRWWGSSRWWCRSGGPQRRDRRRCRNSQRWVNGGVGRAGAGIGSRLSLKRLDVAHNVENIRGSGGARDNRCYAGGGSKASGSELGRHAASAERRTSGRNCEKLLIGVVKAREGKGFYHQH